MLKLIEYFIGTAEMKATPENKNKALSYMQKNNVFFKDLYEKDGAAYFTALRKSLKDKTRLRFVEIIQVKGFVCDLKKSLRRPGIYIGAVLFIISLLLSDSVIWDVRFLPGGDEDTEKIAAIVSENGLKSGVFKSSVDRKRLENLIMLKSLVNLQNATKKQ